MEVSVGDVHVGDKSVGEMSVGDKSGIPYTLSLLKYTNKKV